MKRFRILITAILAVSMVMAFTPVSFGAGLEGIAQSPAVVVSTDTPGYAGTVLIKTKAEPAQEILLILNMDTIFIDNETREAVDLSVLEDEDEIVAYYSEAMTRSIPPQSNCTAIVTNVQAGKSLAHLMTVAEITEGEDGGVKFTDGSGNYIITVPKDAPVSVLDGEDDITAADIGEGDTVFVWFSIVALSQPAQAQADAVAIVRAEATEEPEAEPEAPAALVAMPTAATVLVDGENVDFDAYNIAGNNYFKLRDLAFVLSGSEKQFEVVYDKEQDAIFLTSGDEYTEIGGEMTAKGEGNKTPLVTKQTIFLDEEEVAFTAYNIDGNNYFKLRDIGEAFDFGVDWDGTAKTISIDTSKEYTPE